MFMSEREKGKLEERVVKRRLSGQYSFMLV